MKDYLRAFNISSAVGKRFVDFFENICLSSLYTSKTPPEPLTKVISTLPYCFLMASDKLSALAL